MAQTKTMFFVTIINDKSEQDLAPIVEKYKSFLKIIYLENEINQGPGATRQRGIDFSSNFKPSFDYIMFVDSDDFLYPRAVELLYEEAKRTGADIIYTPITFEKSNGKVELIELGENTTWCHGKIYKTKFLKDKNITFPKDRIYSEDSYFNLIANYMTTNKRYLNESCYLWKNNPNSLTRNKEFDFIEYHLIDYIKSQLLALQFLIKNHGYDRFLISTIANLYSSYQFQKYLNASELEPLTESLLELGQHPVIKQLLSNKEVLIYGSKYLIQSKEYHKDIFLFNETFLAWCERALGIIIN